MGVRQYVTGSVKIIHVLAQKLPTLCFHNSTFGLASMVKIIPHMQKIVDNLVKFTLQTYYLKNKNIYERTIRCNLCGLG